MTFPIPAASARPAELQSTPQEVEAAAVAGISIEEYAKQKMKLAAMKASGEYGEDRR